MSNEIEDADDAVFALNEVKSFLGRAFSTKDISEYEQKQLEKVVAWIRQQENKS